MRALAHFEVALPAVPHLGVVTNYDISHPHGKILARWAIGFTRPA
jgi:hypothetical protein